jgi:hypothetical protein
MKIMSSMTPSLPALERYRSLTAFPYGMSDESKIEMPGPGSELDHDG